MSVYRTTARRVSLTLLDEPQSRLHRCTHSFGGKMSADKYPARTRALSAQLPVVVNHSHLFCCIFQTWIRPQTMLWIRRIPRPHVLQLVRNQKCRARCREVEI